MFHCLLVSRSVGLYSVELAEKVLPVDGYVDVIARLVVLALLGAVKHSYCCWKLDDCLPSELQTCVWPPTRSPCYTMLLNAFLPVSFFFEFFGPLCGESEAVTYYKNNMALSWSKFKESPKSPKTTAPVSRARPDDVWERGPPGFRMGGAQGRRCKGFCI